MRKAWALVVAASIPLAVSAQPSTGTVEQANKETVHRAFAGWAAGGTRFLDILSDDVVWTILGTGPSAVTYRSKADFIAGAVVPFAARLSVPLKPTVRAIYADGEEVITLWDGTAVARDGQPYRNSYAWFFTMRDGRVVRARALLDLHAYNSLLRRVRPAPSTPQRIQR